jgi:hypothetical protein
VFRWDSCRNITAASNTKEIKVVFTCPKPFHQVPVSYVVDLTKLCFIAFELRLVNFSLKAALAVCPPSEHTSESRVERPFPNVQLVIL